uniref:Deoxyribodipyrimidine photo-lyase n=1 Tax=Sinocyclocheilus grahami TaxID=75366 RepID=A0A672PQL4_SINGR
VTHIRLVLSVAMSANKRNLKRQREPPDSAAGKQPKLAGGRARESGWLLKEVTEHRRAPQSTAGMRVTQKATPNTQKIKQGSDGVLYCSASQPGVRGPLVVLDVSTFFVADNRQYAFMLKRLREVAKECKSLDIQFHLLSGEPGQNLWIETVKKHLPADVPFIQVDAHNVVPCWEASEKLEYGARTIRGKITKLLPEFLTEIPLVDTHPHSASRAAEPVDWEEVLSSLEVDCCVGEVDWAQPGSCGGMAMLESFIEQRLRLFATHRNNPNCDALSHLSPWIHTGQLSAQRVVKQVKREKNASESVASFIEELVVRRELADSFCFYNHNYDNISGERCVSRFNHTQEHHVFARQLVLEGKMHGFLRMYWAKKILEWTASPEEALSIAIYLNDRLSLDGCDPNGYVGCMWSVCGIHDQGWAERPIFGKIRFMNYAGCKRKFDVAQFERKYAAIKENSNKDTKKPSFNN